VKQLQYVGPGDIYRLQDKHKSRASVGTLFQITTETLVNHLVGQTVSRKSGCFFATCDVHILKLFKLVILCVCVFSLWSSYMCLLLPIYTPHSTTQITMAYNIEQNMGLVKCKSDHSYYSHHAPLTASQRLQAHKENALTERARWNRSARLVTSIVL